MKDEDVQCLGFKDMNPLQVEALMKVMTHALNLADDCDDPDLFQQVFDDIDEMVRLFGANGLKLDLSPVLRN